MDNHKWHPIISSVVYSCDLTMFYLLCILTIGLGFPQWLLVVLLLRNQNPISMRYLPDCVQIAPPVHQARYLVRFVHVSIWHENDNRMRFVV
nr:MAG TPA: hypothetical protein [Caudoviricetes sp.]